MEELQEQDHRIIELGKGIKEKEVISSECLICKEKIVYDKTPLSELDEEINLCLPCFRKMRVEEDQNKCKNCVKLRKENGRLFKSEGETLKILEDIKEATETALLKILEQK